MFYRLCGAGGARTCFAQALAHGARALLPLTAGQVHHVQARHRRGPRLACVGQRLHLRARGIIRAEGMLIMADQHLQLPRTRAVLSRGPTCAFFASVIQSHLVVCLVAAGMLQQGSAPSCIVGCISCTCRQEANGGEESRRP